MNTPVRGASASVADVNRVRAWMSHHRQVAVSSFSGLIKDLGASLMTWLVIGIALALPMILYLVLINVAAVSDDWRGKPKISIYLDAGLSEAAGRAFATELGSLESIERVVYVSREEALAEFQAMSGFGDVLNSLDRNPLPAVIELEPVTSEVGQLRLLVSDLESREQIDSVAFDLEWLERLFTMLDLGRRLVISLGVVLAAGVLLVIGNTIRLAIENRRSEIEIIKLVGGTDAFVRRPFLYLGFWFGAGGGLIALLLIEASLGFLAGPVELLAQSYRDDFSLTGPGPGLALAILAGAAGLGMAGALLAVGRHLKDIQPV